MINRPSLPIAMILLGAALSACTPAPTGPLPDPTGYQIAPNDLAQGLPEIGDVGRWMVTKTLLNATWLGEKVGGRTLREPINVILLDKSAQTPEQATTRMLSAMNAAGYGPKNMHSDGYYGFIGDRLYAQQPVTGKGLAFSDGPWYESNNHGRLFGPAKVSGGYAFTGSFSRENFRLLPKPGHPYSSFQVAREDLAEKLTAKTAFKRGGYIEMGSRVDTPAETTADHDGRAVLLIATQ